MDGSPSYLFGRYGTLNIHQYTYDQGYVVGAEGTNVTLHAYLQAHGDLQAGEYLLINYTSSNAFGLSGAAVTSLTGIGSSDLSASVTEATLNGSTIQIRLDGPLSLPATANMMMTLSGCSLDSMDVTNVTSMSVQIYGGGSGGGSSGESSGTAIASWTATGGYSDIGNATFYARAGCNGTTTTSQGSSTQTWSAFQDAYDHLEDNQYMVISIDNLPNTDNASITTGFELRGYKVPGAADGTGTYYLPANYLGSTVTVTKANSSNMTVTIDGPLAHNNNSKKELHFTFSGLGGNISSSSSATA